MKGIIVSRNILLSLALLMSQSACTTPNGSGGPEPATDATLPFDPLPYSELNGGERKVFAHYFTPFPLSLDNRDPDQDYYANHYLRPEGEDGRYSEQGGYLRARPLPRPVNPSEEWELEDMRREVRLAKAIGLDGFAVDLLSHGGTHWRRVSLLLDAARLEGDGFRILLMPDMAAQLRREPDKLVTMIRELADHPASFRLDDGRLVVSPYMAARMPPQWWEEQLSILADEGVEVAFVPLFHSWRQHYREYRGLSHGVSDWGQRNLSDSYLRSLTRMPREAQASGLLWMAPVVPQDVRPKNSIYWEAGNSELYRKQWRAAIDGGADWVHLITWNDFSEHSGIAPNTATGYAYYDITAYYSHWFKTGSAPAIVRDAIYAFHRVHPADVPPDPAVQPVTLKPGRGSAATRNRVEMLAFLTAPATLEIELAGQTHTMQADGGLRSFSIPLRPGTPVFRIVRDGRIVTSVTGKAISDTVKRQDMQYHGVSSLR